jgi:hypothetical protein
MRFITVLFYAGFAILIGLVLILLSLSLSFNILQPHDIHTLALNLQNNIQSRIILGLSGLVLILISLSFAQVILGRFESEKTLAFINTTGEITTIALTAVEDILKQSASVISEIKELRPDVIASKRGIIINLRVTLNTETNLRDLTARLSDLVKSELHDVLGFEENVIMRTHIAKITSKEERERKKGEIEQKRNPTVPFSNYEYR